MTLDSLTRREYLAAGAGALATSLAGCSGGGNDSITVALLLPLSGPAQSLGEGMVAGAENAIETSRSEFDVEFELVEKDTQLDPQTALNEVNSAIEQDNADFILGPVSTAVANAIRDTIIQNEVIWINCNAGSNVLAQENCTEYHFRPSFSNWQQSYPFASWVRENTDYADVTVLAADYGGGHEHAGGFMDGLTEKGGTVASELYPSLGTQDYSSQLSSIRDTDPDAVFTFVYGLDEVNFITQYDEFGLKGDIPLVQAWGPTQDILPEVGEAAEGVLSFCHYTPMWDIEPNAEFRSQWLENHDRLPSEWNVQGAESANLMIAALEQTGGDASDVQSLLDALSGIAWTGPRGDLSLDPSNNNVILDMQVRRTVEKEDPIGNAYQNTVVDVIEEVQLPSGECEL